MHSQGLITIIITRANRTINRNLLANRTTLGDQGSNSLRTCIPARAEEH